MNDKDLIDLIDSRFTGLTQRLDTRFEQIDSRFEKVETAIRHAGVQIEQLRDDTRRVAEAVIAVDQKLERFIGDVAREFDEMKSFNPFIPADRGADQPL